MRRETPGACRLPRERIRRRAEFRSTGGCEREAEKRRVNERQVLFSFFFPPLSDSHVETVTSGSQSA